MRSYTVLTGVLVARMDVEKLWVWGFDMTDEQAASCQSRNGAVNWPLQFPTSTELRS